MSVHCLSCWRSCWLLDYHRERCELCVCVWETASWSLCSTSRRYERRRCRAVIFLLVGFGCRCSWIRQRCWVGIISAATSLEYGGICCWQPFGYCSRLRLWRYFYFAWDQCCLGMDGKANHHHSSKEVSRLKYILWRLLHSVLQYSFLATACMHPFGTFLAAATNYRTTYDLKYCLRYCFLLSVPL